VVFASAHRQAAVAKRDEARMPYVRVIPSSIDEVRDHLEDFPGNLPIELETGVPINANSVADLRALATWPPGLRLIYNREPALLFVRVERI
jgi:hypothetical protein